MNNHDEGVDQLTVLTRLVADRATNPSRHKSKICFVLGAGAAISSGGITFADLKKRALEKYSRSPLFDVTSAEQIDARFDRLFLESPPDERALLVEEVLRGGRDQAPSDAYKLLVLLAEAGGIDALVTTNFDFMLERAQHELGRDLFQVYAAGVARPYLLAQRFEPARKTYLKLHGDIHSRSEIRLTSTELAESEYDSSILELLTSILQTHDLILAGYSGRDAALAQIIAKSVDLEQNRIYWCNPEPPSADSPLYARIAGHARFVKTGFDKLMLEIARPILEKPADLATEPTYLRCLFEWRLEYCNKQYIRTYGEVAGKSLVETFARRRMVEERISAFMLPNRPLAIIEGPSGFGKTVVGIRLHKTWEHETTRIMLLSSSAVASHADLEQHVCEHLGGLGQHQPFTLFRLERWLKENDLSLVLFVDGVNEFSTDLTRCVQFFRNILRLCYFLPTESSALRIVATVRQETWSSMLPHLDIGQLRETLWIEGDSRQSVTAISCGKLTDEELLDALTRLEQSGYAPIDLSRISPSFVEQLRDPYLLKMFVESTSQGLLPGPWATIYQRAFEARLRKRGSLVDVTLIKRVLASAALKCLESDLDRFRAIDIQPDEQRGEIIRSMKDINVFVDVGDGFLRFSHDRVLEYFLALGLSSGMPPTLETIGDLRDYLQRFRTQGKAVAAARLFFHLAPRERFPVISAALQLLDKTENRYSSVDREQLFGFAREVLVEMIEQGEAYATDYLTAAIQAARTGEIGGHHLRAIVQATATLPVMDSVPLLARVAHPLSPLAQTESSIYAIRALAKEYLSAGCPEVDLLRDEPYRAFFADISLMPWQRLGRLLSFGLQLGPDNTHPDEYRKLSAVLNAAVDKCMLDDPWSEADALGVSTSFLRNCDRLLFNATPPGIKRFFGNPKRCDFEELVTKLAAGTVLTEIDLLVFEPYTQTLSTNVEYNLCHVLFVLSSFNDLDATLQLVESRLASFSNDTPAEEVDFLHGVLVYLHVLHGLEYDPTRFARYEDRILSSWPDVLLYRPGLERGERRGFSDVFDRIFEDGFGVIYPYGLLLPSLRRRRATYNDYRRELVSEVTSPLPLYAHYLEEFLASGRVDEALQLLHAISDVIVSWPIEGLLTIRGVMGYREPRVRRALLRVLAEAFNRHPDETMQFFRTSGMAVSDDDLMEIKVRHEAWIGRRQIGEEEWARLGHLLLTRPAAKTVFVKCVLALLRADSFEEAVYDVLQVVGLAPAGR